MRRFIDKLQLDGTTSLFIFAIIFIAVFNFSFSVDQWSQLALSFVQGHTYFPASYVTDPNDFVLHAGRYYFPYGPLPAILTIPFLLFERLIGLGAIQPLVNFFAALGVLYFGYQLARKFFFSRKDSQILSLAIVFCSPLIATAIGPMYCAVAHVIVMALHLATLNEYFGKKRYWLIGLLVGLALATRMPAGLIIVFFILDLLFINVESIKRKLRNLAFLLAPILLISLLLGAYNYARFQAPWKTGYEQQVLNYPKNYQIARDQYGFFSLRHIPANLFYFLFGTPIPTESPDGSKVLQAPFLIYNPWGMSIFLTSPYLLYLFVFWKKSRLSILIIVTTAIISVPIFLFFATGYRQFGYRFVLDFYSLLHILFLIFYSQQRKQLSRGIIILFLTSAFLNTYLSIGMFAR